MAPSRTLLLAAGLGLILLSGCSFPAYAVVKEPYVQPTTLEAASLTFFPAFGVNTEIRSYQDTKNCLWIVPLGGPLALKEARTIKVDPGKEFSFRTDFFFTADRRCQLMTTFVPDTSSQYRARAVTDGLRCGVQLSRLVAGSEVPEPSATQRPVPARGSCAEHTDINGMPVDPPAAPAPGGTSSP